VTDASCSAIARSAAQRLARAGWTDAEAARESRTLARGRLGWDLATWLTKKDDPAPPGFADTLTADLERRARHEPVAYILGVREFYGRRFRVSPDVLIPRPETELLVEVAIEGIDAPAESRTPREFDRARRVLDVGTGSGCIAITLALERPDVRVVATDTSERALAIAADNARAWNVRSLVSFVHAPLTADLTDEIDLVVSNPPYVPELDRGTLSPDVRDYEPPAALFAGVDGLDVIRMLVPASATALVAGGRLVFEIGQGQAAAVEPIVAGAGLVLDDIRPDLAGIPRVVIARKPARSL
jgi:release factor glutamine methyltransferase